MAKHKIAVMPNVRADARAVLGRALEQANAGEIKAVYVGIQRPDGTFTVDFSSMTTGELYCHARLAARLADRNFFLP